MSTITKEFTKEQLQQIEAAAKEVMWPVVWSEKKAREHFSEKITPKVVLKLARIALASLEEEPVAEWTNEQCLEFLSIAFRHAEINGDLQFDDIRLGVKMVNGSRAAMLQGAEPVTTANMLPDGWVACSERMPKKGEEVLCTDQFENYETALYDTGYIPGPPFFATTAGEFHPTHWMPLPAAPQQEVTEKPKK